MRKMKKIRRTVIVLAFLASLVLLCACGRQYEDAGTSQNTNADLNRDISVDAEAGPVIIDENFCCKTLDGGEITSHDIYENNVTMLNIWGTFCAPCAREMPDIDKVYLKYKGKGFLLIGVPVDILDRNGNTKYEKLNDAKEMTEDLSFISFIPSKSFYDGHLAEVQSVPQTIFIDINGRQIGETVYGTRSEAEWDQIVAALLSTGDME